MRKLPPLRSLLAFDATARHLSVTLAAEELNISASAVSHQLRGIERYLGVRLFHRTTRSMRLTDAGYRYQQFVAGGLDRLTSATQEIVDAGFTDILTVLCSPSFAPAWLMPRLSRFISTHPDIDLRLRATPDPVDLLRSAVDIEIRAGPGEAAGLVVEPLLEDAIVPMANPQVARRLRAKSPLDALAGATLIHSERSRVMWSTWLRAQNLTGLNLARGLRFDRAYLSIQAAVDGLGVALESTVYASRELEAGRLVRLFRNLPAPTRMAHFLVTSQGNAQLPKVMRFTQWILEEARTRP